MLWFPITTLAQNGLKGTVTGNDGNPIPGVKVLVQETYFKMLTDINGEFNFPKLKSGDYSVSFSYIGYTTITEEVKVGVCPNRMCLAALVAEI